MTRYIVRPASITRTPRDLAQLLNAKTRRYPANTSIRFNFHTDFFLTYPHPSQVDNPGRSVNGQFTTPWPYQPLYNFYSSNKFKQRSLLSQAHVPVPETFGTRY